MRWPNSGDSFGHETNFVTSDETQNNKGDGMDSDTKMARALAFMAIIAAAVVCYISHTAHHLEMHRIGFEKRNGQWVKQQIKEPKQ